MFTLYNVRYCTDFLKTGYKVLILKSSVLVLQMDKFR